MMRFGLKRPVYSFGLGVVDSVISDVRELIRRASGIARRVIVESRLWN